MRERRAGIGEHGNEKWRREMRARDGRAGTGEQGRKSRDRRAGTGDKGQGMRERRAGIGEHGNEKWRREMRARKEKEKWTGTGFD